MKRTFSLPDFSSIILAGERPGGSTLSHAFAIPASVLVPVAGKPSLKRVMEAINNSRHAQGGVICGPSANVLNQSQALQQLLQDPDFQWLAPATGPASSALLALEKLNHYPALLTAGDHALVTGEIVDDFCTQAQAQALKSKHDFVIGLVPYSLVKAAWPESKRTVLKFSNGQFCGSNLFAALNPNGMKALSFWRQAEADRKHPWRIARRFGLVALLRYVFRRLTLDDALQALSTAAGCSIGYVRLDHARAAVDVDSIADQKLAEKILSSEDSNS
jgi:GTP:adenosylcobinamide-phosphate guanylyltransferase